MTAELALRNIGVYCAQIAILIAVAAMLPGLFRLKAPRAQLTYWYVVLVMCVALPFVQPWQQPPLIDSGGVTFTTVGYVVKQAQSNDQPFRWGLGWAGTALALLAIGAVIRAGMLGLGILRLRRLGDRAEPAPITPPLERAYVTAGADAAFLQSDDVAGPVTFGFSRPVILLPAGFFELAAVEQESVATHELLHVRRRDWLFTVGEEMLRALLWFHPGIWFVLNRVQLAREQSVDEAVVQFTRKAEEYVGALLKIAARRIEPDLAPAPLFLKKRHLHERVAAIVKGATMSKSRLTLTMIAVLAMLPIVAGILAWQMPLQAAPQETRDPQGVEVRTGPFKVLHRLPVAYPRDAVKKGIAGDVVVSVTLNEQGEVTDARAISGPEELRKPVLQSVLGWHFSTDPVDVNGSSRPTPRSFEVAVRFTASDKLDSIGPQSSLPAQAMGKTLTVEGIDTSALPASLRERVEAAMPVRNGEMIGPERFFEIEKSLQSIDGHLKVVGRIQGEKTVLQVSLNPMGNGMPALSPSMVPNPNRIRVGGNKQAMNLVNKVTPSYPPLAKQSRIQGAVQMQAMIGKDGSILDLQVISGHPLLVPSALEAVRQWQYRPTLLNGEPVEVITQIDVNYTLAGEPPPVAEPAPQQ